MLASKIKSMFIRNKQAKQKEDDSFLSEVSGVIHVGANTGQERELYNKLDLHVLWIEPIPSVFAELQENIKNFPKQRALQALVTDVENKEYCFHIANNNGASSSIFDFKQHKDIWPEVNYINTISLQSMTLSSLFVKAQINLELYQALVMDTQGSELLILHGGINILPHFKYIKTEIPDFESYEGCCQLTDMNAFMTKQGYKEISRKKFASRAAGGNYFDIIYQKKR